VGVEYGRDTWMLVKRSKEVAFTEPVDSATRSSGTGVPMEKYKAELNLYPTRRVSSTRRAN
jgi:hypothetical protein